MSYCSRDDSRRAKRVDVDKVPIVVIEVCIWSDDNSEASEEATEETLR